MREEVCLLQFDRCERGAVISALEILQEKRTSEGKTNEIIETLLHRIKTAPLKNVKVRCEPR